jgi:hypothetical protein
MFSSSTNHSKLKTNLKLAIQRLKLLERKKTENAHKSQHIFILIETLKYIIINFLYKRYKRNC